MSISFRILILFALGLGFAVPRFLDWKDGRDARPGPAAPAAGAQEPGRLTLFADPAGHFWVEALVNGTHVRFLVDTGASQVALSRADALRVGLPLEALDYRHAVATANGVVRVAAHRLDRLELGPIALRGVEAAIPASDGLDTSLLGMTALSRLSRVSVDGNRLVLEP
ncbi:MAG: TIGR02281 family clan AA aspartic protease [Alphaproteobacteria bacterium]|nr:TIGR02281 family clan AA aspartic protease [Alphaproteobacteria bacterium]